MFGRNSPPKPPSVAARRLATAAMALPLIALARVTGLWPVALLALLGIIAGQWYSHRYPVLHRWMRVGAFALLHLLFVGMCVALVSGIPYPQAQFALYVQALTSFDLRRRRSLMGTLLHSLVNLYVAATFSRSWELGLYLALFAVLGLALFWHWEREDGEAEATRLPEPSALPAARPWRGQALRFGGAALGVLALLFLVTPRYAGRPIVPPFSLTVPLRGQSTSEIVNPALPLVQVNGWSDGESDYYYGFDQQLDLRYRGGLSDAIVMYVRSPSRSYWRSHSFDFYDGLRWDQSDESVLPLRRIGAVRWRVPNERGSEEQLIVQSFTIARDQPNLVFAAYQPTDLYLTANRVSLDSGGGIRAPEPLQAGLTYSVLSYRPDWQPEVLRAAGQGYPPEIADRYLQLPASISERTRALARELAAPHANPFDQVDAMTTHLREGYEYDFFPPPHPPGAEVVDNFLFVDRRGICEQYVTALVVMARSLGIPARLVVGYGSGDYNALTGYYEVRARHAHAWAEVYFPDHGWVPFDPTPGWTPNPYPTPVQRWFLSAGGVWDLNLPIGALAERGLGGMARAAPWLGALLACALGAALLLWLGPRLRRPRVAGYSALRDERRRAILRLYRRGVARLGRGTPRRHEAETLAEFQQRHPAEALAALTRLAERAAYDPAPPNAAALLEAEQALRALERQRRGTAAEG